MNIWTFARVVHIRLFCLWSGSCLKRKQKRQIEFYLETLIDLIASIKLMILKRYQDGQPVGPASSPDQSFEVIFDQLVTQKYSTLFIFSHRRKKDWFPLIFSAHPVAGNTDGFVQGILNDMEQLYTTKQQRSSSLNT